MLANGAWAASDFETRKVAVLCSASGNFGAKKRPFAVVFNGQEHPYIFKELYCTAGHI
jgi:hypothetical protein